jgi:hypothetical protein
MPLKLGYMEHFPDGTVVERKPFHPAVRAPRDFHWVELKSGTEGKVWTLFLTGPRVREWGFLTKMGWIQHENYQLILDADAKHKAQYIRDEGL